MRIVIDMQGAQGVNRFRGIGRYLLALSRQMVIRRGGHEVLLLLNSMFPEGIDQIRAVFDGILPEKNICVWHGVDMELDETDDSLRYAVEMSREAYIANLRPDFLINGSLFEGLTDNAVTSIGALGSQGFLNAVVLYDLIPMIYSDIYFNDMTFKKWYLGKVEYLRRADLLLAISASTGREAVELLGISQEKTVNISTACEDSFRPHKIDESGFAGMRNKYGIVRPFVLYTGGLDPRKNIDALIRAYSALNEDIRKAHQLVIVCQINELNKNRMLRMAADNCLDQDKLIFTGFIPDEDLLKIYNACKLFIFPSLHEGFGIPVLEAMSCGRAVIGSNNSGVAEVIGREDAQFDPADDKDIAAKLLKGLTDDKFRSELEEYGLERARDFSWEHTADKAWKALETAWVNREKSTVPASVKRPRMAFLSPLPPQQSGIADYSAELLPELGRHYDIDLIAAQDEITTPWIHANCSIRDVDWFRRNAHEFDRILYHFGGSVFHEHMFSLLSEFPGVVVLHDFFLSNIINHMDAHDIKPAFFTESLFHSHGWKALYEYYRDKDITDMVWNYPCNLKVLQDALGVIVHSDYSCRLAEKWYGTGAADDWTRIPLLREPAGPPERALARRGMGLSENDFIVCSFGQITQNKLNSRLVEAWLKSPLAEDPHCHLVFVGHNIGGEYGAEVETAIRKSGTDRITVTGWMSIEDYRAWLNAADIGVQLRTMSRGETSAAILDCMNYGLATIVNKHGSMTELPDNTVLSLPDDFICEELSEALTFLWENSHQRDEFGRQAREFIREQHCPARCADMYAVAIENYYRAAPPRVPMLLNAVAEIEPALSIEDCLQLSSSLAKNFPPNLRLRTLFLDISEIVSSYSNGGMPGEILSFLRKTLLAPPAGWRMEPIYVSKSFNDYCSARRFTGKLLDIDENWAEDMPVDYYPGDILLSFGASDSTVSIRKEQLLNLRRCGIRIFFLYYGHSYISTSGLCSLHDFDGLVCVSKAVADKSAAEFEVFGGKSPSSFEIIRMDLETDTIEQLFQRCKWNDIKTPGPDNE